jgi:DNA-binding NtrC family response regulator
MTPKEQILIVDDDRTQAATLARMLGLEGYRTRVAESGAEALREVERGGVDLVLTDLEMPGMDGMELFRRLRQDRPELPVMVVTAPGTIETAIEAVRDGVVDFVQKPVCAEELIHRFGKVFRERALRSENAELKKRLLDRDRRGATLEEQELSIGTGTLSPRPGANGDGRLVDRLMSSEIAFDEFEREVLVQALQRTRGNQSRAARLLGMTRRTLQYRIDKFKIDTRQMK